MQVATDEVDARTAPAVANHRQDFPRRQVEKREDRHALGRAFTTDGVFVAVGQHEHIPLAGPMADPILGRDPTRALGDDVEQDQSLRSRMEYAGHRCRLGLDREAFPPRGRRRSDEWQSTTRSSSD